MFCPVICGEKFTKTEIFLLKMLDFSIEFSGEKIQFFKAFDANKLCAKNTYLLKTFFMIKNVAPTFSSTYSLQKDDVFSR